MSERTEMQEDPLAKAFREVASMRVEFDMAEEVRRANRAVGAESGEREGGRE